MAEALLTRLGAIDDPNAPKLKWLLCTEVITENKVWTAPGNVKNQEFQVRIFGGGGGASFNATKSGGGGGWMNNNIISLAQGSTVDITIGKGGAYGSYNGSTGGTTSFGSYLSAAGGDGGYIRGSTAYGGNGGSGGGSFANNIYSSCGTAGTGYQFGGGGAGGGEDRTLDPDRSAPGGKWGGSGGWPSRTVSHIDGTDTSTWTNVDTYALDQSILFRGEGKAYNSNGGGNGGFGGNGGTSSGCSYNSYREQWLFWGCGGGGGYGADGGNGQWTAGGGGGGYGGKGADSNGCGGGGGGYGPANYGAGGGGWAVNGGNGKDGICIIQYYQLGMV